MKEKKYEGEMKKDLKYMDRAEKETTHAEFGPEEHGMPEEDWPKKFVVDGGLKYEFGPEAHGTEHDIAEIDERAEDRGGEDIPGKTHKYDRSPGKIQSWPKKFEVGGEEDKDFEGTEEKDEEV